MEIKRENFQELANQLHDEELHKDNAEPDLWTVLAPFYDLHFINEERFSLYFKTSECTRWGSCTKTAFSPTEHNLWMFLPTSIIIIFSVSQLCLAQCW